MSDEKKSERNYIVSAFWAIFTIMIVSWGWPEILPVQSVFDLWTTKGTVGEWLFAAWPIFIWGIGVNIFAQFMKLVSAPSYSHLYDRIMGDEPSAVKVFFSGTLVSVFAGVTEEIAFRWLLFFSGIAGVTFTNFLFFGFAGFGIPEWFYVHIFGPLTNWVSFGHLAPWLFHPAGWQVGAGLLSANAFFRDGHKYQGLLGWINSWCLGLVFFYLTMQYGLLAAILVHFAYDFSLCITVTLGHRVRHGSWT